MEVRGKPRIKGGYNQKIGDGDMVYGKFENTPKLSNEYYPTNILKFSNADHNNKLHPTQKPVDLLEYLIKTYTKEGDIVLDNCMGVGSTGVACINTNLKFIGMELDGIYFEVAENRIINTKEKL